MAQATRKAPVLPRGLLVNQEPDTADITTTKVELLDRAPYLALALVYPLCLALEAFL